MQASTTLPPLRIIEAPFNLGLKQLHPDREPGVAGLPAWLEKNGLYEGLPVAGRSRIKAPDYQQLLDPESEVLNVPEIVSYSRQLANEVRAVLRQRQFPLVIGGDCSILLGCTLALKQMGTCGLFFLDGHTDFVPPSFSATKAAAGMDLAFVTGNGPAALTNIDDHKPYVKESNCLAMGNRFYHPQYESFIRESAIDYWPLKKSRENGFQTAVNLFLDRGTKNFPMGFWIHLDLDVLQQELMPCVDSPQAGGMNYAELGDVLQSLLKSGKAIGLDITILDSDLDPDGRYTQPFVRWLQQLLKPSIV